MSVQSLPAKDLCISAFFCQWRFRICEQHWHRVQETFRTFTLGCGRTSALPFGCICRWIGVCFASLKDLLTKPFPPIYKQQFWVRLWSLIKSFLRWKITWRVSKTRLRRCSQDQTTSCLFLVQCLNQCFIQRLSQDTTSLHHYAE